MRLLVFCSLLSALAAPALAQSHQPPSAAALAASVGALAQQAYLKASNTGQDDEFGGAVAISGDTIVVGAWDEQSTATGVDGDGSINGASYAGAAYVFVRNGTTWAQQAYLKASNTEAEDDFGFAVAISGDTIVVGAYGEDSSATGANGNQVSNGSTDSGAVYVFVRNGTTWTQQAYLKASNTGSVDQFGRSVSVSGDTLLVGAWFEDSNATGVGGSGANDSALESGAAYVFVRNGTTWSQQAYLKASNTGAGDRFGYSVSLDGDTALVGAYGEDSNATGVGGDQANNGVSDSGAGYVFVRNGSTWSQQAYLKASNTGATDWFGSSTSLAGDTALVGAYREDSNALGVDGNQGSNSATDAGAAYVFVRSGTSWSQQAYLKASNTWTTDWFGYALAVSGDTIAVGAIQEDSSATGVDGDQGDNSAVDSGATYLFTRSGTTWTQQAYLKASNTETNDIFGYWMAVHGGTLVVGAKGEDGNATGVGGDQGNNAASDAGAAYVFDLAPDAWSDQGSALAGVLGNPLLVGSGSMAANSTNHVDLSNAAPSAFAGLFIALSSTPVPFKGGSLLPGPLLIGPQVFVTSPSGAIPLQFVLPPGAPPGSELWLQWAILDAAAVHGVALSNAISGVTP